MKENSNTESFNEYLENFNNWLDSINNDFLNNDKTI